MFCQISEFEMLHSQNTLTGISGSATMAMLMAYSLQTCWLPNFCKRKPWVHHSYFTFKSAKSGSQRREKGHTSIPHLGAKWVGFHQKCYWSSNPYHQHEVKHQKLNQVLSYKGKSPFYSPHNWLCPLNPLSKFRLNLLPPTILISSIYPLMIFLFLFLHVQIEF